MSTLAVETIENLSGTNYNFIKQVKQAVFRGNYTFNDSSYQDIIDLSVVITPHSTSSKILVECVLCALLMQTKDLEFVL